MKLLTVRAGQRSVTCGVRRRPGRGPAGGARAVPAARRDPAGDRAGGGAPGRALAGTGAAPPRRPVPAADRRGPHRLAPAPDAAHGDRLEPRAVHTAGAAAVGAPFGVRRAVRPGGRRVRVQRATLPADDVLDVLSALLAQSVLTREETPAGALPDARHGSGRTGADWLEATGDGDRLRRRHRDWGYVGLATWCRSWSGSRRAGQVAAPGGRRAPAESAQAPWSTAWTSRTGPTWASTWRGALWFHWSAADGCRRGRHWLEQAVRLEAEPTAGEQVPAEGTVGARPWAILGVTRCPRWRCSRSAARRRKSARRTRRRWRTRCTAGLSGTGHRRHAARGATAALRTAPLPGDRRAEQQRADGPGRAGDDPGVPGRSAGRGAPVRGRAPGVRGPRRALGAGYALYVLAYATWSDGEPVRARELLTDCLGSAHRFRDQLGSVLAVGCSPWSRWRRAMRRRLRCCRGRRLGCGRRWGCRCSARRTTTPRTSCAEARRPGPAGRRTVRECVRHGTRLGRRGGGGAGAAPARGARLAAGPRPTAGGRAAAAPDGEARCPPTRKGGETAG